MSAENTTPEGKTFAEVIQELTKRQEEAEKEWRDALSKYDDPTYGEEFEDTLQRKYDEGQADALKIALEILSSFDYAKAIYEAEQEEGRSVLNYLSDIFDGLDETDIWGDYFEQVSCGACGEFYTEGNEEAHQENCDENPANMDESAKPENHFHNPKEIEILICQLCGDEIKDLNAGGVVLPWGNTCGNCIAKIKENKPNFTKENN
jgi:hypothetical protein